MGIKAIDFSEVPAAILPLVAGVLSRLVYNVQFWMDPADRTPVCIVCDEAHLYLPERCAPHGRAARRAARSFEAIAKEGRKYGVCIAVVSQRPSDVSRTILSQCNNFMIMRLTNDQDQEVIRHLVSATLSSLTGVLPMLDVGETVLIGDAILLPMRIKLDTPQTETRKRDDALLEDVGAQGLQRRRDRGRGRGDAQSVARRVVRVVRLASGPQGLLGGRCVSFWCASPSGRGGHLNSD